MNYNPNYYLKLGFNERFNNILKQIILIKNRHKYVK
jgi:hypothetical protein